jgi:hypothetical protein
VIYILTENKWNERRKRDDKRFEVFSWRTPEEIA